MPRRRSRRRQWLQRPQLETLVGGGDRYVSWHLDSVGRGSRNDQDPFSEPIIFYLTRVGLGQCACLPVGCKPLLGERPTKGSASSSAKQRQHSRPIVQLRRC